MKIKLILFVFVLMLFPVVDARIYINGSNSGDSYFMEYADSEASYSYLIYQPWYLPGYIVAKNGTTGRIEYASTNASYVVNNAANQLARGGSIYFKKGVYNLVPSYPFYAALANTSILISYSNIELTGENGATLKMASGVYGTEGGRVSTIIGTLNGVTNLSIHNLNFDSNTNGVTSTFNNVLFMFSVSNLSFKNNFIANGSRPIYGDSENNQAIITGNIINGAGVGQGISLHNTPYRTIISNNIVYNFISGIFLDSVDDTIVEGNEIRLGSAANSRGIELFEHVNHSIISNNLIRGGGVTAYAIYINTATTGKKESFYNFVQGNHIYDSSGGAFYINGTNHVVKNNYVYAVTGTIITDVGTDNIKTDNYGVSPFNFGVNASTPSAFGVNDMYVNSSRGIPNLCQSTASGVSSWAYANNGTLGC